MRFHVHGDGQWQVRGCWRYFQCKCGARRVRRHYANLVGPVRPGWAGLLRDSHGQDLDDSGWVREPEGGWPVASDLPALPHGPAPGAG